MLNTSEDEQITISRDRYNELLEASWKLDALEIIGVESWEGFDLAVELFNQMKNCKSKQEN